MLRSVRPFVRLLKPHKGRVALSVLAGSVAGLGNGAGLAKLAEVLFGQLFDDARSLALGQVALVASLFPALFLLVGLSSFCSAYLINRSGLEVIRDLRIRLFERLQALPLAYIQKRKTGDLVSRITADTQLIQLALTRTAKDLVIQPVQFLGALAYLTYAALRQEGVLYIYVCVAVLPAIVFPIRHISRKLERRAKEQQEELGDLTSSVAQNLGAAREVRAFNLQDRENRLFRDKVSELLRAQLKVVKYAFSLSPVVEFISSMGLAAAFVIGYLQGIEAGVFLGIFLALYMSYAPLKRMGAFAGELHKANAALSRIQEVVNQPLFIDDPPSPAPANRLKGEIEFRDVAFDYGDSPALRGVTAAIPPGSTTALVGPSGAGKSTFANLVPRFYDPTEGAVFIDGIDARQYRQRDLRRHVAIVSQEPILFDATILENIRLGREGATDEEARQAARLANADAFIRNLPDGYDTLVGERGTRLSGGQKQRVAIARAFLRDARILILDEATSALDSESEKEVQAALEQLVAGRTTLLIAHRFSSIRHADTILVFDDGRLIDSGSHAALYGRCPRYRNLYDQQRTPA